MNGPNRSVLAVVGVAVLLAVLAAPSALAQPGGGGGDRAQADMTAAWTLQAQGVAGELQVNDEQKQKLVDAYLLSRKNYQAANASQTDTDRRARFEAMRKAGDAERATLSTALGAFLTPEQVEKALKPLGSFNRQYDRMTETLIEFKLDAAKRQQALAALNVYASDASALREKATSSEDWQGMRATMEASKAKLDTAMADVLDAAQLATWKESTAWRGRGERPRGGGGPGGAPAQPGAAGGTPPAESK